jgi:mono/diheme cytochrome c family protein
MRRVFYAAAVLLLAGCSCGDVSSSYILQRMEVQPKYNYYQANPLFADGRAMRTPPDGTVPREAFGAGHPEIETGMQNGAMVAQVPVKVDAKLLAEGKMRFEIVCATCHGVIGDGHSVVSDNFPNRLPPSLVALTDKPAGFFYRAATYGFGVMPSFSGVLDTRERWAVTAYIQALQLSQNVALAQAPADIQKQLLEEKE